MVEYRVDYEPAAVTGELLITLEDGVGGALAAGRGNAKDLPVSRQAPVHAPGGPVAEA